MATGTATTYGATAIVNFQRKYPVTVNHSEQTAIAADRGPIDVCALVDRMPVSGMSLGWNGLGSENIHTKLLLRYRNIRCTAEPNNAQ